MKNLSFIISCHSKPVFQPNNKHYGYSCRKRKKRPLDNKCLIPNNIYEAQVTNNTNDEYKKCLDEAETSFKERYMKVYEVHRPFKFFLEFEESRYNIHS